MTGKVKEFFSTPQHSDRHPISYIIDIGGYFLSGMAAAA
jgi:hypothetical protein